MKTAAPRRSNIFKGLPSDRRDEVFDELLLRGGTRIERIVSRGHKSPEDFWYDQPNDEWVMLLQGSAILRFADPDHVIQMEPGDYVHIPAHVRHRVDWTSPSVESIWLAVHFPTAESGGS